MHFMTSAWDGCGSLFYIWNATYKFLICVHMIARLVESDEIVTIKKVNHIIRVVIYMPIAQFGWLYILLKRILESLKLLYNICTSDFKPLFLS